MWSEEQVKDAEQVLWSASEQGEIQKVTATDDKDKKECYLVINTVTYTDPLYLKALERMINDGKFVEGAKEADRVSYCRGN
jgi:hypothetical protein